MELFEHFKDPYHRENERTKSLQDSLSVPIGIISILATLVPFYLLNFDFSYQVWFSIIFVVDLVFGVIFLGSAAWNIYKAFNITNIGSSSAAFKYLPVTEEQNVYYEQIKDYYINTGGQNILDAERSALVDFQNYLQKFYVEYATNNSDINATIYSYITEAKAYLWTALLILLLDSIPYGFYYKVKPESSTKFEIIKSIPLQLDSSTIKILKHG